MNIKIANNELSENSELLKLKENLLNNEAELGKKCNITIELHKNALGKYVVVLIYTNNTIQVPIKAVNEDLSKIVKRLPKVLVAQIKLQKNKAEEMDNLTNRDKSIVLETYYGYLRQNNKKIDFARPFNVNMLYDIYTACLANNLLKDKKIKTDDEYYEDYHHDKVS